MTVPINTLQTVQTYQSAELGWMYNSNYSVKHANKKFEGFQTFVANLGDSVTFDIAPVMITTPSLVTINQSAQQRKATLTVANSYSVSNTFTDQQFLFNVEDYMSKFGKSASIAIGTSIEKDFMNNITSSMTVNDPQSENFGHRYIDSGPYRFFGDGITAPNSFTQLRKAVVQFGLIGCANYDMHGIIPPEFVPDIVASGLGQFAPNRNNDLAQSWELGEWANTEWFESNLCPTHVAGTIGTAGGASAIVTVVSTNDPTGFNATQITVTEPTGGTSLNAIKAGDLFQYVDQAGFTNLRQVLVNGKAVTSVPVQFMAVADAATTAGTVTVTLRTTSDAGLVWATRNMQNINGAVVAGMKFKVMPSHRAGLIHSGNQFYMAMPKLPSYEPWPYSVIHDEELGVSLRHYWGNIIGQNQRSYTRDCIAGAYLLPDNSQRVLFPLQPS